jgi:flagellar biosynthesis protein FlhB
VHKSMEESPPPGAAKAQNIHKSQNINSFLSFLVPTICLLSCIPTALAWTHTTASVGTIDDANFYQLLSNTAMQLLGLLTLIWPTVFDARLATMAWFWTWILGGVSVCCTAVAVPVYLWLPTGWSGILSFSGSVAQALVVLQLAFVLIS